MNTLLYQRNVEGWMIFYDVRSEHKPISYQVQMLGLDAVSCNCDHFTKGHAPCKHMRIAEEAEILYQKGTHSLPKESLLDMPLNGNSGFSLLKL